MNPNPEYHDDGQCDHVNITNLNKEYRVDDFQRCTKPAAWRHRPTGLCYCCNHTKSYEGKIDPQWEPI